MEMVLFTKLLTARDRPNELSVCGLSLLDISRMLRIASSMTYVVLAISSASSFEEQFLASSPSDMRADESSGPRPSCSSLEKLSRSVSSVRSTVVSIRRSVSFRW